MYCYEAGRGGGFDVRDEGRALVCTAPAEADAREIVAALNLVGSVAGRFPGTVDGQSEVNGGDLVETFGLCVRWGQDGRFSEPGGRRPEGGVGRDGRSGPGQPRRRPHPPRHAG